MSAGKKLTTKEFIDRANSIHKGKYDYSMVKYVNSYTPVTIICPVHDNFNQIARVHLDGSNCPMCVGNVKMSQDDYIKKCNTVHGDTYDYSLVNYVNLKHKIDLICKKHGVFTQIANNHLNHKHGCPVCNTSKGELEIQRYLNDKNIKYIRQYSFETCKNIRKLKFDFYLPQYNICIEYDGQQHFVERKTFGGKKRLKYSKKLDDIKNKFCIENKIKLIRIKFDNKKFFNNIFDFYE